MPGDVHSCRSAAAGANWREPIFFGNDDHRLYRDLLREAYENGRLTIWA